MREYYVYILASQPNGTLYTGVTSDLIRRVGEHRQDVVEGCTRQHSVHVLVYFEQTDSVEAAILREKQIKNWKRDWKKNLIERGNPFWQDLYPEVCGTVDAETSSA